MLGLMVWNSSRIMLACAGLCVSLIGCDRAVPADAAMPVPTKVQPIPEPVAPASPTPTHTANPTEPLHVQNLPSGVMIEDLALGSGAGCPPGSTVTIHYRGTLKNGTEFDSSHGGDPATFPLGRLIKGWQEGIPGMKAGGKRRLTIPYMMAYGEQGMPPVIPPKSDLVFEIEMISFE